VVENLSSVLSCLERGHRLTNSWGGGGSGTTGVASGRRGRRGCKCGISEGGGMAAGECELRKKKVSQRVGRVRVVGYPDPFIIAN
jgi:hypothetical protein